MTLAKTTRQPRDERRTSNSRSLPLLALAALTTAPFLGCTCAKGQSPGQEAPSEGPKPAGPRSHASAKASASSAAKGASPGALTSGAPAGTTDPAGGALVPCEGRPITTLLAPGLTLQRFTAALEPPVAIGDRCITMARVDPARYRFRLLTAEEHGGSRPVTEWLDRFQLTGVTNASMFAPSLRSIGLMVDGDRVNNGDDNDKLGGFMAFGLKDGVSTAESPPVTFFGRTCPSFDLTAVRRSYRTVVQNYRLLDCDGRAIPWKDEKSYSAAAVGQDRDGWVVLIHSRTPYTMTQLASILASPALRMRAAMFVEGGPEASLHIVAGGEVVREIGSYESEFRPDDSNKEFWAIPNVIGFAAVEPRAAP